MKFLIKEGERNMQKDELSQARIQGRTYSEIQEDVLKLTYYYVNLWYTHYPLLKKHGLDREQVATDVFYTFYKHPKKNDRGYSNLEESFIKASNQNFTMSYISNLVRKSVLLVLSCASRGFSKKPVIGSLDDIIQDDDKGASLSEIISNNEESTEAIVELKSILESIKNRVYEEYYYIDFFNKKCKLTTHKILDWIVDGYTISEMQSKVFDCSSKSNIEYRIMSQLKKETIELAREKFYES